MELESAGFRVGRGVGIWVCGGVVGLVTSGALTPLFDIVKSIVTPITVDFAVSNRLVNGLSVGRRFNSGEHRQNNGQKTRHTVYYHRNINHVNYLAFSASLQNPVRF